MEGNLAHLELNLLSTLPLKKWDEITHHVKLQSSLILFVMFKKPDHISKIFFKKGDKYSIFLFSL